MEIQDEAGRRLAKARLPEGISGIARLHALVGRFLPEDGDAAGVKIGIETDRGPWVAALVASGYQVYAINPLQSARARQGQDVSGAKSDAGDAHVLADLVRTHSHQLRTVAGDSKEAGAVKVLTRMHQSLIWDRTRQVLRLRSSLREFFPAALEAYEDLDSSDVLELLTKAPEPSSAARLTRAQVGAALKRARRRDRDAKTTAIMAALRTEHLTQPPLIAAAYGVTVRALAALITTANEQITALEGPVEACFGRHPGAQDGPPSGLAEVELSVRVPAKTSLDRPFQGGDLLVGGRDQGSQGPDSHAVRGRDKRRLGEVLSAQRGHDRGGLGVPVAPTGPLQGGADLRPSQPGRTAGFGCLGQ